MPDDTTAVVEGTEQTSQESTQEATIDQAEASKPVSITDIDSLPEELQALAKQLQGDYTRKTQELAAVRGKADAFEELSNNPGFVSLMENIEKYGSPVPPAIQEAPAMSGEEWLLKAIEDPNFVKNMIREEAQKIVDERVSPLTDREARSASEAEITRLSTKYSDFNDHQDAIAEMIEQSKYTLDPETAYKVLTYDSVRSKGVEEGARVTETRVKAASVSGSKAQVQTPVLYKSMAEAYIAAKKAHGVG
jgi:hypothetical protein